MFVALMHTASEPHAYTSYARKQNAQGIGIQAAKSRKLKVYRDLSERMIMDEELSTLLSVSYN